MARTFSPLALPVFVDTAVVPSPSLPCALSCIFSYPAKTEFAASQTAAPAVHLPALGPTPCPHAAATAFVHAPSGSGLPLHPGEPFGLPASEPPPMSFGIEWPLETVRDVATPCIA